MAKTDPAGNDFKSDAYVLGDIIGSPDQRYQTAWETCVLKAHGHTCQWTIAMR